MPVQKHKNLGLVRALVVSAVAMTVAGCPGYLEEGIWLSDAGAPRGAYMPPAAAPGTGGAYVPPASGAGGNTGSVGAGGTPVVSPPRGSGGSGGGGGGAQRDAGPGPAPDMGNASIPVPACATAAEITSKILMPKCARCHGGATPSAGLDLAMPGAKARLLNVQARCAGKTLVVDSPAVGGHLFDKLAGAVQGCGQRMPLMGTPLSAEEITCLKAWIKPEPPAAAPKCYDGPEIQKNILTPKCGVCHGVMMPAAGLDLVTPGSKARMLNQPAKLCVGKTLITNAGGAVGGHFFDKLNGAVAGCGMQMPFGAFAPLSAYEVQCLKDWIVPPAVTQ
jgi:hypothetical protein